MPIKGAMFKRHDSKALLIIDMLNDFVLDDAPLKVPGIEKIIEPLKREIKKAHEMGYPVIYVCDSHDKNDREFMLYPPHAVSGSKGSRIIEELKPLEGDIIVSKNTLSAFYNTGLESILKNLDADELIITGCVINICIFFAAYDAVIRGFKVNVIRDAVAGFAQKDYDCAIEQMQKVLKVNLV